MIHNITPRQLDALVAAYVGASPSHEPDGVYGPAHPKAGEPIWRSRTRMGGAVHRMVTDLRDRGYLTERDRHDEFGDKFYDRLTVQGFDALIERLDKLPVIKNYDGDILYRFAIDRAEIEARRAARVEEEAEQARKREEARIAARDEARASAERRRVARLAALRELFEAEAIGGNWSDEKLLEFATKVADVAISI
jgi:hypothetical protein